MKKFPQYKGASIIENYTTRMPRFNTWIDWTKGQSLKE